MSWAAGICVAEQLGKAIDRLLQAGEVGVLVAVPVGVDLRIAEPVIGAQVDDANVARRRSGVTAMLAVCGSARNANRARSATLSASNGSHARSIRRVRLGCKRIEPGRLILREVATVILTRG